MKSLRDALVSGAGDALSAVLVIGSAARGDWRQGRSDVDLMVVLRDDRREVLTRIGHPLLLARYASRVEAMILREDEIPHAADVFPLLYDEAGEDGVAIHGSSPFKGLKISDRHRALRVEQELREARIRLRRMVTDGDGAPKSLAMAVERKLRQVRSPLRSLLRLRGSDPGADLAAVLSAAGRTYDVDVAPLAKPHDDAARAYDTLTRLLAAAIDDADRRNLHQEPTG
ncbi:MAG: nucleotidyltransferase domain-containing protein [Polyangiales bacterium]